MLALALIVLTQTDPSVTLIPLEPPAAPSTRAPRALDPTEVEVTRPTGSSAWFAGAAASGAIGFALAGSQIGRRIANADGSNYDVPAMLVGSLVGLGAGFVAGYLAKQGNLAARITTVALVLFAHVMVGWEAVGVAGDYSSGKFSGGGGGGWGW